MATMVRNYLGFAQAVGVDPDMALLAPILAAFQSLSQDDGEAGPADSGDA
jgi:hypothetical protein